MTIRLLRRRGARRAADRLRHCRGPRDARHRCVAAAPGHRRFRQDWTLPFHTTDFSRIKDSDYKPAFEQGMAIQRAEIEAIKANPEPPTFDNTIVALERSGGCSAASTPRSARSPAPTPTTRSTRSTPRCRPSCPRIRRDQSRPGAVRAGQGGLRQPRGDEPDARGRLAARETYDDMVHAGAMLSDTQKDEVKAINGRLSELTTKFSQS
jgi:peptidyl-dipeptidase Dcp